MWPILETYKKLCLIESGLTSRLILTVKSAREYFIFRAHWANWANCETGGLRCKHWGREKVGEAKFNQILWGWNMKTKKPNNKCTVDLGHT